MESAEAVVCTLPVNGRSRQPKVQACTAVARELAGFIWAIGQVLPPPAALAKG